MWRARIQLVNYQSFISSKRYPLHNLKYMYPSLKGSFQKIRSRIKPFTPFYEPRSLTLCPNVTITRHLFYLILHGWLTGRLWIYLRPCSGCHHNFDWFQGVTTKWLALSFQNIDNFIASQDFSGQRVSVSISHVDTELFRDIEEKSITAP